MSHFKILLKWLISFEMMHLQLKTGDCTKMDCTMRRTLILSAMQSMTNAWGVQSKCSTLLQRGHRDWWLMTSTWTEEGCIVGRVLDGGVSAVKLTQVSWLGRGGEWDDHIPSLGTWPEERQHTPPQLSGQLLEEQSVNILTSKTGINSVLHISGCCCLTEW